MVIKANPHLLITNPPVLVIEVTLDLPKKWLIHSCSNPISMVINLTNHHEYPTCATKTLDLLVGWLEKKDGNIFTKWCVIDW